MSDEKKSKSKKAGRSKKGELGVYTTAKHKARRIKREEARQSAYALTAGPRLYLRKLGALRRIERRLEDATGKAERARLDTIRGTVEAALVRGHGMEKPE